MRSATVATLALALAARALAGTNDEGLAYLEANKGKEGVVTLPSGLQYKVLRTGTGDSHPTADSSCECHYAGTLIDGTTFDSSYDRGSPTSFAPNQARDEGDARAERDEREGRARRLPRGAGASAAGRRGDPPLPSRR